MKTVFEILYYARSYRIIDKQRYLSGLQSFSLSHDGQLSPHTARAIMRGESGL